MTAGTRLFAGLARLGPCTRFSVRVERDLPVTMSDGEVLLADRWYADDGGVSDPVVVVRTPYGRSQIDLVSRLLAERGLNVVVQSCRGTFGSSGHFEPFFAEENDGADTLTWLDGQAWASGEWLLFGVSYLGLTAWSMKRRSPRPIGALALAVTSTDFRRAVIYPSGRFGLSNALAWRYQLRDQELPNLRLWLSRARLTRKIRYATREGLAAGADVRAFGEIDQPYRDWLDHESTDPWWKRIDFDDEVKTLPPTLLVAGWYDLFLDAQLDDYARMRAAGHEVRLVIGPWVHSSPGLFLAAVRETLNLFTGDRKNSGARVWFGGTRRWTRMPEFPPRSELRRWTLGADARLTRDGGSSSERSEVRSKRELVPEVSPAPAAGGRTLFAADAGRRDQRHREGRSDVLIYTTEPLAEDLTIVGRPSAGLAVEEVDGQPWFVRLCDVSRSGRSHNVSDGTVVVAALGEADRPRDVEITLSPTAHVFRRGHRIRLQVSAEASPTYAADSAAPSRGVVFDGVDGVSFLDLPAV